MKKTTRKRMYLNDDQAEDSNRMMSQFQKSNFQKTKKLQKF